ncbi:MAG: hypothetical protein ABI693_12975 [Bryobacteraceae bacterium]
MSTVNLGMGKSLVIRLALLAAVAEVVSSMAVWHGTPTDWIGAPLRFWDSEVSRLRYWCVSKLLFAALWVIGWLCLHRRLAAPALAALGGCALGADVMTSLYFWKSLSAVQVGYLGWPSLQRYIGEHLISWVIVTLLGLAAWLFSARRRRIHVPPPLVHG